MADNTEDTTLSRLVSELSLDERNSFLEKLQVHSTLSGDPLYEEGEAAGQEEAAVTRYARLPWYLRLCFFILSYLKSKSPVKIFEDRQLQKLGREIETRAPGLYNYQQNLLLLEFLDMLTDLRDGARFFFTALDLSVNRDKGGFYAFLGSLEMGEMHHRLITETVPELFTDKPDVSERELRQAALRVMETICSSITETQRSVMYYNARSLYCLKELASFPFDRVITIFDSSAGGQTCPVNAARDLLISLNNILYSLKDPPALPLLESLFIYRLQERSGEPGFDMNGEMQTLLGRAEEAIAAIRNFNKRVPLTKILRCSCRDTGLAPQQISGGEDWFVIYREYWKKQVETKVIDYIRQCKHNDLLNTFRYFLKGTNLKVLENVVSDANPSGIPVPEAFALSFLLTFHAAIFVNEVNLFLRPILIDGEFFKKENRSEFTGAYNDIMKAGEDIKMFDAKLSPAGEYGTHYNQAKEDISALALKQRKMQQALDTISHDASGIIIRSRDAMTALINILNGILKKDACGKYDTLANFEKLSGNPPDVFINGIAESIKQFQQALQILSDINAPGSL